MMGAMKDYAKRYQLMPMQTFNGLVSEIIHHRDRSPTKRPMIRLSRFV